MDYAGALREFRILHSAYPANNEITYGFAMLASQQESWAEARAAWQALRNEGERFDEATYYLGQLEEANGNNDLAVGLYGVVDSAEFRTDALIRRTALLAQTGRLAQARDELEQGRVTAPDSAVALYVAETQLLQKAGESEAALGLYKEAIDAHPEELDLLYNRALYKGDLGDLEGLERDLRLVLAKDEDNADALNALGYTLADRNERLDEAYSLVARALKLKPDSAAVLDSMGWVLYRRQQFAEAVVYLRKALAKLQDDEIAAHLGEVLWISGEREEARKIWREALIHSPQSAILKAVQEKFSQ
jgi:tetratricopeptide (TPR) repeat protein